MTKIYNEENFINKGVIYYGEFTEIHKAYSKKDGQDICLKRINLDKMEAYYQKCKYNKSYVSDIESEINALKKFSDYENSLKFYGSYDYKNERIKEKVLVLELCDGNLKNFMEQNKKSLPIETIKEIFSGLNKVFQFMIGMNIIHRDLKLENLLIKYKDNKKKKFIVKLGDYGICKFLNQGALSTGPKGTPETMAPEILLKKK